MQAIYKYPIEIADTQYVEMPLGAQILSAQMQGGQLCLWAKVEPDEKKMLKRKILVFGTGHPMPMAHGAFVDTVQMGSLVWHVFALAQ